LAVFFVPPGRPAAPPQPGQLPERPPIRLVLWDLKADKELALLPTHPRNSSLDDQETQGSPDGRYPYYCDAEVIVVVQDNLNTHSPASLYEAFWPQEAKWKADGFKFHYTPKHGSWLDMAEIELGRHTIAKESANETTSHRPISGLYNDRGGGLRSRRGA